MDQLTKTQIKELEKMKAGYTYSKKQKQAYALRLKENGKKELSEFEIKKLVYFYNAEPSFIHVESPRAFGATNLPELKKATYSKLFAHNMKRLPKADGVEDELWKFLKRCEIDDEFKKCENLLTDHGRTYASMCAMIGDATKKYRSEDITLKAMLLSWFLPID